MSGKWRKINQQSSGESNEEIHDVEKQPANQVAVVVAPEKLKSAPKVSMVPLGELEDHRPVAKKKKPEVVERETVKRTGGGQKWEDKSLLEWDPAHFRLFVGNLSSEVNDDMLRNAFRQYATMSKVKVVRDNKAGKNRGYGFVAFSGAEDYFRAFKEMNGKYIGNHPVQLKRAMTEIKRTTVKERPNSNSSHRHKPYGR